MTQQAKQAKRRQIVAAKERFLDIVVMATLLVATMISVGYASDTFDIMQNSERIVAEIEAYCGDDPICRKVQAEDMVAVVRGVEAGTWDIDRVGECMQLGRYAQRTWAINWLAVLWCLKYQ